MAIPTNGIQLVRISGAVFNQQLSAADYSEILAANRTAAELDAWANAAVAAEFKGKTTTDIAKAVLANVGLSSVSGLEAWVAGQLNAGGGFAKAGATLLTLLNDYSNMSTTEAVYGASVATFNTKAANSQVASQTAGTASGTYAAVSSTTAAEKAAAALLAAQAVLTTAATNAASAAATAIAAATTADTALTAAQTAQTAAAAKAALTDATVLAATTKTLTDASTAAATAKTVADAAVVTANTALTTALNVANPVASDVVTANANVIIATAKAAAAASAATTAVTAAGLAKTASDAASADDLAAAAAQTALNTSVTAATKAAADAVIAATASKAAAAATTVTTDDTVAAAAVSAAGATGAGAAKITADAAAKVISDAAAKVITDAAAKVISDAAAKVISDAAAKVITDAAAEKVIADALALTLVAKPFTLTTGVDVSTGGAGADTYTATHLTLNTGDVLDGGAGTADTLTITDTGTAVWTLPTGAYVSNFETIKLKNVNTLTAASTGTTEKSTLTMQPMLPGQTLTVAGQTLLATAGLSASAVATALAGTATSGTGFTLAGSLSGWTKAAGTAGTNTIVYTSSTATAPVADLTIGGTAQSGLSQVNQITVGTAAADTGGFTLSFNVNGVSVTTAAIAAGASKAVQAEAMASAINAYLGKKVATSDAVDGVAIVSSSIVSIGPVTTTAIDGALTTAAVVTNVLAPQSQVITITTDAAAATGTFTYNGVSYTTATAGGTTVGPAALAFVNKINEVAGANIATNLLGVITINFGGQGGVLSNFVYTGSTFGYSSVVASSGIGAASPSAITSTTQGVAGTNATTGADVIDASKFVGSTSIVNDVSTGDVTVNNVASTQTVTINGNGAVTNGATTVQSATTSTSSNVTVSGVTAGALTLSSAGGVGVQTATLTSSGDITNATVTPISKTNVLGGVALGGAATALNIVANTSLTTGGVTGFVGTAATITATGTGTALNLGTLETTTVKTVDASGFAGAVTATLNSNAALSFKGGSGNDVITTGGVLVTGSVDAGAGTGDVLVVGTNLSHVNTATLGAKYTNFEAIRLVGTYDASLVPGITSVQLTSTTNTITNLSAAQTVVALADIGTSTLTPVSGTTNTLNMTMGTGLTTTAATNAGPLTLTGYETVNITTAAGPTAAVGGARTSTVSAFSDVNLAKVNLFGTSVVLSNIATTLAVAVDGAALTGNGDLGTDAITGLTVAGSPVSGSSFKGSAVRDSFTLGTAVASTYDAGAGSDFFSATAAQIGDAVTDPTLIGGDGTDTINITSTLTLVDADFKKLTSFEKLILGATTAVSVTGLTTNTIAAFPTTLTVTGSTLANDATYSWESLAYDKTTSITLVTAGDLASTADNVTIVTGAGNDTVKVTAASAVGTAGAGGTISVTTGAGVDTISVETGILLVNTNQSVVINAGTGADLITIKTANQGTGATFLGNVLLTVAAGDSSTTAYDVVTGFKLSHQTGGVVSKVSDGIDFAGTSAITTYAATAATGYTAGQLTVAVSSAGLVTFAGTSAASITLAQAIAAVQSVVATTIGDTAVFTYTSSGLTDSYVFNNNTTDSIVKLVGVSAVTLLTTNSITTADGIFIS